MNKKVLISGASIARPALTYWPTRYEFDITIVEPAPDLRPGGQAVDFRGQVHLSALEKMGILEGIRRHQTGNGALHLIDAEGRDLVELPGPFFGGDVETARGDRGFYRTSAGARELEGEMSKLMSSAFAACSLLMKRMSRVRR
ncbi:MAG: putative oxidoreductase [Streptosporangiaceae bacterium]|nr:putative oxidoreductase [Streptosporangiaceae bacterium]